MRLAYADPPYPGMAEHYPEKTEVDHIELIARLSEYDGWALSTDERSLAYVLPLCPPATRVLAWCRSNSPFFNPNPAASWEPVLCQPARFRPITVRSYMVCGAATGPAQRNGLTGQKPRGFCEWVIRCMGAKPDDTLDDIFPGTGSMTDAWVRFQTQPPLFEPSSAPSGRARTANIHRRMFASLDGLDQPKIYDERQTRVDRHKGRRKERA